MAAASASLSSGQPTPHGPAKLVAQWQELVTCVGAYPGPVQPIARAGLRKVVAFLDTRYGAQYLDYLDRAVVLADLKTQRGRQPP